MIEEFKIALSEAEAQHDKLVVLHTAQKDKIIAMQSEEKNLSYLLAVNSGRISAYKKCIELIGNKKEE